MILVFLPLTAQFSLISDKNNFYQPNSALIIQVVFSISPSAPV
ncbi:hypothetical protein LAHI110946_09990 [Lactococcus hircilactis]